jgi:hypothetical protein
MFAPCSRRLLSQPYTQPAARTGVDELHFGREQQGSRGDVMTDRSFLGIFRAL